MRLVRNSGVLAYCLAESFEWAAMKSAFLTKAEVTTEESEAFIKVSWQEQEKKITVFIFSYGCCVFWNTSPERAEAFCATLKPFAKDWHETGEYEEFYHKKAPSSKVEGNTISLCPDDEDSMIAISYALSQAVKLSQYEVQVEQTMLELETIPQALTKNGTIAIGRRQALQKTGKIFMVRSKINLHSDLLDTPDYFWDRPKSEKMYLQVLKEMDQSKRLGNMNKRLDILQDIYGLLMGHIEHTHSFWVEIVIVLLIAFEVLFGILNWVHLGAHA